MRDGPSEGLCLSELICGHNIPNKYMQHGIESETSTISSQDPQDPPGTPFDAAHLLRDLLDATAPAASGHGLPAHLVDQAGRGCGEREGEHSTVQLRKQQAGRQFNQL